MKSSDKSTSCGFWQHQLETDNVSQAYLFTGTRERERPPRPEFWRRLFEPHRQSGGRTKLPCGECENAKRLRKAVFDVIEMDAASNNGVDDIRDSTTE